MKGHMDLEKYITSETVIGNIKNEYLNSNLSMKDMLNGKYADLPVEDKTNLICWSADYDVFAVLENGTVIDKMDNNYFEAVEVCPHCMSENIYPMWDTEVSGFVAVCKHCGKEILLCDECQHTILEDGEVHECDWCETKCGGKCHRGTTRDDNNKEFFKDLLMEQQEQM